MYINYKGKLIKSVQFHEHIDYKSVIDFCDDILCNILQCIGIDIQYKTIIIVCKRWCKLISKINKNILSNQLLMLILRYPEKGWNWYRISQNPNITLDIMEKYPNNSIAKGVPCWNLNSIFSNPNITMDMIERYHMDMIEQYPEYTLQTKYDYYNISHNPNLTIDMIKNHLNENWDWYEISRNPGITMDVIEKYPDNSIAKGVPCWSWFCISENPNLTMDMIKKYPKNEWDWCEISKNPNITIDIIEKYPDNSITKGVPCWHWGSISCNPNITIDNIKKYPKKKWDWWKVSSNKNITMDIIKKYPDNSITKGAPRWNYDDLLCNPNISMDIFFKIKKKNKYIAIGNNPNIAIDIIKYPNKPWDWNEISSNKFSKSKKYTKKY